MQESKNSVKMVNYVRKFLYLISLSQVTKMPIPTPFYPRTAALSESHEWRDWSGYLAASLYEPTHEREYYAIRNSAALIDASPLFKYEIRGLDAERLVNRIFTRDVSRCAVGQVMYSSWCDDEGKVIDDGTISRLDGDHFRITSADPNLAWFRDCAYGMDVQITDVSIELATLALQGPKSRQILQEVVRHVDLESLHYYRWARGFAGGIPLQISRTGYTGDLGYELWISPDNAERIWDLLMAAGEGFGITPAGMLALDIARIEAGLVLIQVDYVSTRAALIESQKSTPYEINLGWSVNLEKPSFVGRSSLINESRRAKRRYLTGLEVDWEDLERLYGRYGLAPQLAGRASRSAVPIYSKGNQVGQMTSHTFSPVLKKYIGIGTIEDPRTGMGDRVEVEVTIEHIRHKASAQLVKLPFFDPPRKRA
jgi:aminomethyltransferase